MPNPLITNVDLSKIFLGRNRTIKATYTNPTGAEVTLNPGRIFGRVIADNKVLPQDKDSTDGSQQPRFVLMSSHVVAIGGTATLTLCVAGDVDQGMLSFASGESLTSAVGTTGLIGDLLMANSGIILVPTIENTRLDNQ